MSRVTFSGPLNVGQKTLTSDSNSVARAQIGTPVLAQSYSVAIAAGETKKHTFILPKNAKVLAVYAATTATTGGTSLNFSLASTDTTTGNYVTQVDIKAVTVLTAAVLLPAFHTAARAPTADLKIYATLVSTGHAGVVDLIMTYLLFADSTQTITASAD